MKSELVKNGLLVGAAAFALAALAGCSGGDGNSGGTDASGTGSSSSGSGASSGLTYYRDVKAIVDAKCTGCHYDKGIAPFSLTSFDDVAKNKDAMVSAIGQGIMPPWPPAKGCSEYLDDRSLSDDQISTIKQWVKDGAQKGDPKDAPTEQKPPAGLSRIDRTLTMPTAYTPTISPDDYRCFLVDWPDKDVTYVTGFGVEPGTPAIVHHVIAYLIEPNEVATYQSLDDADPAPGYTCFGGPGAGSAQTKWIGGWAPGALGSDFPKGTGIEIAPGSKVVLQVHYNTSTTPPTADTSKVVLKVDPTVEKKAVVMPWTNPAWITQKTMVITAHTPDVMHDWSFDPSPYMSQITGGVVGSNKPYTIYSPGLHMHTRGTHAITKIQRAGGADECMLDIPKWNFHWQGSYGLSTPKQVNPGDKLSLECHWDNEGPMDLNWGEGTGDEMCLATYFITE